MIGWLINDCLTCIPGTKTFWHDLLESIPGLINKTYSPFQDLPLFVERQARISSIPDYIVRNATYFRKLNIPCPTISLLQDIRNDPTQLDVCNSSDIVVCNSSYTFSKYKDKITSQVVFIPLGIDFDLFSPQEVDEQNVLPDSILFVGAANNHPKGFDRILDLINNTNYNFCLVMKDSFTMDHPRVKVFNRLGHAELVKIYNQCKLLVCSSRDETQHLAGLEAAACNLPIVATNVGLYYNREDGEWGVNTDDLKEGILRVLSSYDSFSPREYFLSRGYSKEATLLEWKELITELVGQKWK